MTFDLFASSRMLGLFFLTAIAELLGCYLPLLWLTGKGSTWLLLPAALSLAAFVWLLTLHPAASGRVYASYGAVYIATALGIGLSMLLMSALMGLVFMSNGTGHDDAVTDARDDRG